MATRFRRVLDANARLDPGEYRQSLHAWIHAIIACPKCGLSAMLSTQHHKVARDGVVSLRYGCLVIGCPFLDYIVLDDWGT